MPRNKDEAINAMAEIIATEPEARGFLEGYGAGREGQMAKEEAVEK